ncbi:MAG TPA: cupin domain-containing protein [Rudaea sp.]|nr:cupin domain-containing protein [Rudaea sp.]
MKRGHVSPAIEVHATRERPLGMPPARFLRDYWQKHPLLIRGGFPTFGKAIAAEDLAGLACEEAALSRIVLRDAKRDGWTLRNGPFAEADFATLPATHWTLLVQDVDKWDLDVAKLLAHFDFLPSWRIDDVMVSYATDGGGVGAHVDQYDVFLIQGRGQRQWRIDAGSSMQVQGKNARIRAQNSRVAPSEFRDDTELKLLRHFTPTHEWLLEPGDALYLPPGIAHDGIAVGECMTFSVGMRAPSQAELLLDFAESLSESLGDGQRFVDPDLAPPRNSGEIDAHALARVRAAMPHFTNVDSSTLLQWFGRFITRYRAAHDAAPRSKPMAVTQLEARLPGTSLLRNPWSRTAWARDGRATSLFVSGQRYPCPLALARLLAGAPEVRGDEVLRCAGKTGLNVVAELVNAGHWQLVRSRAR